MKSFTVKLENKETEVIIRHEADLSESRLKAGNSLLVTDDTMINSLPVRSLIDAGFEAVVIGSGEKYKNLSSIQKIAEAAAGRGLDRSGTMIGIGGGVICDMTAFSASVYMRGCELILVPTTLLSMVDASIGGKTGIDFLERKNLLGSFYPAAEVLVFTEFLDTLSSQEYKSGLAEIIKHGFLSGEEFLSYIEERTEALIARDSAVTAEVVYRSLRVKAGYIEADFREKGIRAHLNLGHTFGHALESAAGLGEFTHGEAVAWGIQRAVKAGLKIGLTDEGYAARVERILRKFDYDIDYTDFDHRLYIEALSSDKKKKDGKLRFILQRDAGETVISPLDESVLEEVLNL